MAVWKVLLLHATARSTEGNSGVKKTFFKKYFFKTHFLAKLMTTGKIISRQKSQRCSRLVMPQCC